MLLRFQIKHGVATLVIFLIKTPLQIKILVLILFLLWQAAWMLPFIGLLDIFNYPDDGEIHINA